MGLFPPARPASLGEAGEADQPLAEAFECLAFCIPILLWYNVIIRILKTLGIFMIFGKLGILKS